MKVVVTETISDDMTYESLEIVIDDITKFHVYNDSFSIEDNTLSRNFSDCYDIPLLLEKAYQAGKNGEKLEIIYHREEV